VRSDIVFANHKVGHTATDHSLLHILSSRLYILKVRTEK